MTPVEPLLLAPELIVIELVDAALVALERALCVEHPLLHAPSPTEHPPVRRLASAVLRHAERLRGSLRAYRRLINDVLRDADQSGPRASRSLDPGDAHARRYLDSRAPPSIAKPSLPTYRVGDDQRLPPNFRASRLHGANRPRSVSRSPA